MIGCSSIGDRIPVATGYFDDVGRGTGGSLTGGNSSRGSLDSISRMISSALRLTDPRRCLGRIPIALSSGLMGDTAISSRLP